MRSSTWFYTTDDYHYQPDDKGVVRGWAIGDALLVDRSGIGKPYGWKITNTEYGETVKAEILESMSWTNMTA